jgi:hypothetical protein
MSRVPFVCFSRPDHTESMARPVQAQSCTKNTCDLKSVLSHHALPTVE